MTPQLIDYLEHIETAAAEACKFTEGMTEADFLADRRTQQAVIMSLIIIGEATTRMMDRHRFFVDGHPLIPWFDMRGMRNRMAHGYFDVNLSTIWRTVQVDLPALLSALPAVRAAAEGYGQNTP